MLNKVIGNVFISVVALYATGFMFKQGELIFADDMLCLMLSFKSCLFFESGISYFAVFGLK